VLLYGTKGSNLFYSGRVNSINILVTLNSGYLGPLCSMLRSLCHNNKGERIRLFVAHTSLTGEDLDKIRESLDAEFCELVDIKLPKDRFHGLPHSDRWPPEACFRLFAAHFLPDDVDRLLYLDPDIIVLKPLTELYNIDLKGKYYAAATHMVGITKPISRWLVGLPRGALYVNSGVLLMDLDLLRKEQKDEDIYRYAKKNLRRLMLYDQDILNGLYHDKILYIDPLLYNLDDRYMTLYNLETLNPKKKITHSWVLENTHILHFCGKKKPWREGYKGRFAAQYKKYAE